jgi:hypothetical protein
MISFRPLRRSKWMGIRIVRTTRRRRCCLGRAENFRPQFPPLQHAAGVVSNHRLQYGEPTELFAQVARRWSYTLGSQVTAAQVARCLIDLKLARLTNDPAHLDSIADVAGYAACLREVSKR